MAHTYFENIFQIRFWQTCPWLIIWRCTDKMWEAADQKIAKRMSNRFLTMAVTSQELIFYILSTMNNEFWKIVWKVAISMRSFRPFQFPFDAIDFSFQQKIKRIWIWKMIQFLFMRTIFKSNYKKRYHMHENCTSNIILNICSIRYFLINITWWIRNIVEMK